MTKNHGPQLKNDKQYDALRDQGMGKEKAARIANAPDAGKKGGEATAYENHTKKELMEAAKTLGIVGRSMMDKRQLIKALKRSN